MNEAVHNVDDEEIRKFSELASRWWDSESEFKPLHDINPARLGYIDSLSPVEGKTILDVGCGGGLLAEGLAQRGAKVTGIDMAEASLSVAKLHLYESKLEIDYQQATAEAFAETHVGSFDIVTCLEMLEHVPDPASVIAACAKLVKPGGHVYFSTINRTPLAFMMAIVGAEYIMNLLPRGTHQYAKLIQPAELSDWARAAGLTVTEIKGLHYNPLTRGCSIGSHVQVNYLMHTRADADS